MLDQCLAEGEPNVVELGPELERAPILLDRELQRARLAISVSERQMSVGELVRDHGRIATLVRLSELGGASHRGLCLMLSAEVIQHHGTIQICFDVARVDTQ